MKIKWSNEDPNPASKREALKKAESQMLEKMLKDPTVNAYLQTTQNEKDLNAYYQDPSGVDYSAYYGQAYGGVYDPSSTNNYAQYAYPAVHSYDPSAYNDSVAAQESASEPAHAVSTSSKRSNAPTGGDDKAPKNKKSKSSATVGGSSSGAKLVDYGSDSD